MTVSWSAVRHRLSDFLARDRQLPAPQLLSIGTTDTVCQPRTPPLGQTPSLVLHEHSAINGPSHRHAFVTLDPFRNHLAAHGNL